MRRAFLLLLFLCFARSPELIAAPRFDALFTTRVEYYDDEEYFSGRYAPLYQSVQFSLDHLYKDKVGFSSYLFTAKDLASGDDFDSKVYSMFLEVRDVSRLSSGRFGRFVLTSGVGIQTLTGADVTLSPGKDLNLELYLGRNKVFYDTRFQEPLLFRAPFTDTGLVYGGNLGVNKFRSAKLQVGWQTFDSETEAEPQNYMTYQFSGQFPRKLLFELRGYQNVSSDAGSDFHARITGPLGGGGRKSISTPTGSIRTASILIS